LDDSPAIQVSSHEWRYFTHEALILSTWFLYQKERLKKFSSIMWQLGKMAFSFFFFLISQK